MGLCHFDRMDFQQTYIPHEYLELKMPAAKDAEGNSTFAIDPNHLHIWPRHSFMLIALPNKVCSSTSHPATKKKVIEVEVGVGSLTSILLG